MKENAKHNEFILLDVDRYENIYSCIRGCVLNGHDKDFSDEVTWMRRGVLLRHFEPLEKELFVHAVESLLNKSNGHLVTDDELIGLQANDVDRKSLSYRKAGEEGQVYCLVSDYAYVAKTWKITYTN